MSTEQDALVTPSRDAEILASAAQMRVVRGDPDDLEVAALVAGLVAVASSGTHDGDDAPAATGQWTRRSRPAPPLPTGGDSWRWSLR